MSLRLYHTSWFGEKYFIGCGKEFLSGFSDMFFKQLFLKLRADNLIIFWPTKNCQNFLTAYFSY